MYFEQLLLELNEKQKNFLIMLGCQCDREDLEDGLYFDVEEVEFAVNINLDNFMSYVEYFDFLESEEIMYKLFNQFPKLLKDVVDTINEEWDHVTDIDNSNMTERQFLNYTNSNLR